MTKIEMLEMLKSQAKTYVKDGVKSVKRNEHMNELGNETLSQNQLEAVIVDFINSIGVSQGVDYGLYTSDIK